MRTPCATSSHPRGPDETGLLHTALPSGDRLVRLTTSASVDRRGALPDAARHVRWEGSDLVVACDDGTVVLQRHASSTAVAIDRLGAPPTALAVRPGRIVVGGSEGTVLDRSQRGRLVTAAPGTVTAISFVGGSLVVAARQSVVVSDDVATSSIELGIGAVTAVTAVSGRLAAVGGTRGLAWLDTGLDLCDERIELPTIVSVTADPFHRCVALGDLGGSIHLVGFGGSSVEELTGYPDRVETLAFTSDGRWLCTTAADELTAWPVLDGGRIEADEPVRLLGHDHEITALAAATTGGLVATGDTVGRVRLWHPTLVDVPIGIVDAEGVVLALAWRADARALAMTTSAGELLLVDVEPGELV